MKPVSAPGIFQGRILGDAGGWLNFFPVNTSGWNEVAIILHTTFRVHVYCMPFDLHFWFKFHWNVLLWSNWQWTVVDFGLDNGLARNRRQTIIWTNDGLIHLGVHVSLSVDALVFCIEYCNYHIVQSSLLIVHSLQNHNDVIKWKHFPHCWPFVREFINHRWTPLIKASDAKLWCFLRSAPEQTVEQRSAKSKLG